MAAEPVPPAGALRAPAPPLPRFADYAAARDYLYALKRRGIRVGLERMRTLARILGHPERQYPVLHLAGTNGKGSTAAMLDAILRAAGRRVGLYTSPHLVHQGERVQVDRRPLPEAGITRHVNEIHAAIEAAGGLPPEELPSFFEFMTGMAFREFAQRGVEVGVIEVGLGGRLDATNIVDPLVSVVTSIGLDHCEILGDRPALIAAEKAGIVKPGRPVVIGRMEEEAAAVIRAVARDRGSPVVEVREVYGDDLARYPETALEGDYQRWNAASATLAAELVADRFGLTREHIARGLREVFWPGRWQRVVLPGGRLVVLDASHNPQGAEVLERQLAAFVAVSGPPVAITGTTGAGRASAILPVLGRHCPTMHIVHLEQERSCSAEELRAALPEEARARAVTSDLRALFPAPGVCTVEPAEAPVLVTGSIYLLGEVLQYLRQPGLSGQERMQDW